MKKLLLTLIGSSSLLITGGCATHNNNFGYGGQPTGIVYSNYTTPGSIADSKVKPVKTGESCTQGVLWVAAWGNSGTADAMAAGGITKVASVQYTNESILSGLYSEYCTVVMGE